MYISYARHTVCGICCFWEGVPQPQQKFHLADSMTQRNILANTIKSQCEYLECHIWVDGVLQNTHMSEARMYLLSITVCQDRRLDRIRGASASPLVASIKISCRTGKMHKTPWRDSGSVWIINCAQINFQFLVRKVCRANYDDMVSSVQVEIYHIHCKFGQSCLSNARNCVISHEHEKQHRLAADPHVEWPAQFTLQGLLSLIAHAQSHWREAT